MQNIERLNPNKYVVESNKASLIIKRLNYYEFLNQYLMPLIFKSNAANNNNVFY